MKPKLIYDGDCDFCSRWVEKVKKRDTDQRIEYVPAQTVTDGEFSAADRARFKEAVHFLDTEGILSWGAYTIPHVLKYLPKQRKWLCFFRLSGVLWIADVIYRRVARKRHCFRRVVKNCSGAAATPS